MIAKAIWAVLLMATRAMAGDYCALPMDQVMKLPATLAGDWQMVMRSGLGVVDGKPVAMPVEDGPDQVRFTADGGDLALAADSFFPATALKHIGVNVMSRPDLALPGESPLEAAELLQPEITASGLPCDPNALPQFVGEVDMGNGSSSTLRVYAFGPEALVLVIKGESGSQAARVVFDLTQGG